MLLFEIYYVLSFLNLNKQEMEGLVSLCIEGENVYMGGEKINNAFM